jgi:lipoic acid synthetase
MIALQRELREARAAGRIGDLVLTVEHDPVFTVGRSGSVGNLLVSRGTLVRHGIPIVTVERGGDITYHGPGQLVAYPILDLRDHADGVRAYVRGLEEAIIRALETYGVDAGRSAGRPGVWVGERKIASIGIHVRRWITMHGVAINVDVDRSHFAMIRPCGLPVDIVSLRELTEASPSVREVGDRFVEAASRVFGWAIEDVTLDAVRRAME